jgi:hypothetical protein
MSASLDGFNAEEQQGMLSFEPLPKGDYIAMATDSDMKDTKAGTGKYLQFEWQLIDGAYKGRKLWARLNLVNPNQTAVDIANRELGDICKAVGVVRPKDSAELHGIPVTLTVTQKKRSDTGEMTNEITGYSAVGSESKGKGNGKTKAPAKTASKPPWA